MNQNNNTTAIIDERIIAIICVYIETYMSLYLYDFIYLLMFIRMYIL